MMGREGPMVSEKLDEGLNFSSYLIHDADERTGMAQMFQGQICEVKRLNSNTF